MELREAAEKWLSLKEAAHEVSEEMRETEEILAQYIESVEGGSKTSHLEGFKFTVKRPINRTIDGEAWERVRERIPAELRPVRIRLEPDAKGCEWLAKERPDLWAIAAEAITEKPGKPGYVIEREEA